MKLVSENSVRFKVSSIVQTDTIRMSQSLRTDYTGFRLSRNTTYKSIHFLMHQSHSRPIIKKDPFITTRHTVSVGRFVFVRLQSGSQASHMYVLGTRQVSVPAQAHTATGNCRTCLWWRTVPLSPFTTHCSPPLHRLWWYGHSTISTCLLIASAACYYL